jgi:hypothetical protein
MLAPNQEGLEPAQPDLQSLFEGERATISGDRRSTRRDSAYGWVNRQRLDEDRSFRSD